MKNRKYGKGKYGMPSSSFPFHVRYIGGGLRGVNRFRTVEGADKFSKKLKAAGFSAFVNDMRRFNY